MYSKSDKAKINWVAPSPMTDRTYFELLFRNRIRFWFKPQITCMHYGTKKKAGS